MLSNGDHLCTYNSLFYRFFWTCARNILMAYGIIMGLSLFPAEQSPPSEQQAHATVSVLTLRS